ESEGSHSESPNNLSNRSHRSHRSERGERSRREGRREGEEPRRERRYEEEPRRIRRYEEELRRAPLDTLKCKIPPFVGDEDVEWLDLRRELRTRFVSASYARDLYNKLQRVYQGSKNIEKYFKEMEVSLMGANVLESYEAIMARFCMVKRCLASKRSYPSSSSWKGKEKEKENDLERTRAERKKLSHITLVLLRIVALSVLSAWVKCTLSPTTPIEGPWL
ncbi:hypothetical protein CR513_12227, partial [Mucuna pruriens]